METDQEDQATKDRNPRGRQFFAPLILGLALAAAVIVVPLKKQNQSTLVNRVFSCMLVLFIMYHSIKGFSERGFFIEKSTYCFFLY